MHAVNQTALFVMLKNSQKQQKTAFGYLKFYSWACTDVLNLLTLVGK